MKEINQYIDEIYEKYEETKKTNIIYKKVEMKEHNYIMPICATFIGIIILITLGYNKFNVEKNNNYVNINSGEKEILKEEKIYTNIIRFDEIVDDKYIDYLLNETDLIFLTSNLKIEKIENLFFNEKLLLKTYADLKVNKVIKGDITLENKNITCSKLGGKILMSELKKDRRITIEEIEKEYVMKEIKDIDNSYFLQLPMKGENLEENKEYLVLAKYDEKNDVYTIFSLAYGLMEYDPETKKVRNPDTGKFEDFDWTIFE